MVQANHLGNALNDFALNEEVIVRARYDNMLFFGLNFNNRFR